MTLSHEQLQFLEHHQISLSCVFDATALRTSYYQMVMKELGFVVAYGVTPCNAAGHTLRTSAGHCPQCKPSSLAFVLRYDDPGEVYVAHSPGLELTKIGVSNNHQARLYSLNHQGYGGTSDWTAYFCCGSTRAGRAEFLAQKTLSQHRQIRPFAKSGKIVNCQELFDCNPTLAVDAVKAAVMQVG